jgi:hypothetical protein
VITDTGIKLRDVELLAQHLGDVESERLIALIQRESFDYTQWRQQLDRDLGVDEISARAMRLRAGYLP